MSIFVQVAVNVPSLTGVFDYAVPESLSGRLGVGHLVTAPFGKQTVQGVVLRFVQQPAVQKVKDLFELVDPEPVLTQAQIALAEALAESTFSPLASIIGLFLPPGLSQQADVLYQLNDKKQPPEGELQKRLFKLLEGRGPLRGRQIERAMPHLEWRKTANYLVKRGLLNSRSILPPASVRPKFVRTAQLAVSPEAAQAAMPRLGNTEATRMRRQKALRFLIKQPGAISVSWVYADSGCNLKDLQELAERELILLNETEIWRDPLEKIEGVGGEQRELILTDEQKDVWRKIEAGFQNGNIKKPFLLQGVTGSGKTEIYIRAAQEAVRRGKQAIILVPEISLTPQTVRRFLVRFPGQVGLIHSKLSEGERYDTWRRARAGMLKVLIGPRSALFTPLPSVGLIAVDECHDASYYQSEPPFYHAVSAAQTYARLCGGLCILGSATPSVVQRYQAEVGESLRLELTQRISSDEVTAAQRAKELDLPSIHIVDMRDELKAGNRGIFSREISEALAGRFKCGRPAIPFLN